MAEISDEEIIGRINFSYRWLRGFRQSDITASSAYIDSNGVAGWWDENWNEDGDQNFNPVADVPDVVPVGQPNYMAINTEVSSAAVSSQTPKLHVRANEGERGYPGAPAIIQQAWQQVWSNGNFKKEMRAAYQKRKICGLGCVWYRWDDVYGFVIENVTSNRFFFDPHATNLRRLRYAGVAINLPISEAMRRYDPDNEHEYFGSDKPDVYPAKEQGAMRKALTRVKSALSFRGAGDDDQSGASGERSTCKIYIYFDREEEVHVYQDQVLLRTDNLYGGIPMLFRGMFTDPRDRILPLGMNVFARGLNEWLVWLASIAANTAKNGGPITLYDSSRVKGKAREALEQGSASQMIGLEGMINPQTNPIIRVPAEQLSPAYSTARMEVQSAMDGIMGASPGMRGESSPGVTATSAMLTEAKSNAMMVDEQNEFEEWCTDVATAFVACTQRFGGPEKPGEEPTEAELLWHAFQAVNSVMVVHGSTSFSNPAMEVQASMQLFTTALQSDEYWRQAAAAGMIKKVPKLETIFNDMLIALNRTNIDEYWMDAPPPPQGPSTIPVDVVDWMTKNYPLSPPDVQRQMEQMLGFQPSQTGMPPEPAQQDNSIAVTQLQHQMEMQKLAAKAQEQQSSHVQEMRMQALKTQSDIVVQSHKAALEPKETPANGTASRKKTNS